MVGAIVASLLVPLTLFYPTSFITHPVGKGLFSIIIVLTAFGFKNIRLFSRHLIYFYFTSFAIGGGLIGVYYFLGQQVQSVGGAFITYNEGYGDGVSWLFVLIGFPCVWWFTRKRLDHLTTQKIRYDQLVEVTIKLKDEEKITQGFIDSGNQLVDPITKRPVIVCDELFLKQWFSEEDWNHLKICHTEWSFDNLPESWADRIRIVPYQGIDGARTFMLVLKPDNISISYNGTNLTLSKVLIGIQFGELASDGSYHCLLHPHLLKTFAIQSA